MEKVERPVVVEEQSTLTHRRLLFLSHATPEDNEFSQWLATQLATAGYEVWCDATKLLGGERFWNDIAEAIDSYSCRFLFASTLESNRKAGTLRELKIARETQEKHGIRDFIVPLKVDQLPFTATDTRIRDLNFVRFDSNWADGLSQLLRLLEREGVPKSPSAGPACVADWHRRSIDERRHAVVSNEKCFTNWFALRLPPRIQFYRHNGPESHLPRVAAGLARPNRVHASSLVTFADAHEVRSCDRPNALFSEPINLETASFVQDGSEVLNIAPTDASNIVTDLVRQAWDAAMAARGLKNHNLANGLNAWFFKHGHLPKNKAYYRADRDRRAYRQLVGRKSKRTIEGGRSPDGFWHYAVSASPQLSPIMRIVLRHHVIFTDDGATPWTNDSRMHRARRSVCKRWWNHVWRDRLFAFCGEVSDGKSFLALPVGDRQFVRMAAVPLNYTSPWTYLEGLDRGLDEAADLELVEEEPNEENADGPAI